MSESVQVFCRSPHVRSLLRDRFMDVFQPIKTHLVIKGSYVSCVNSETNRVEWSYCAVEDIDRIVGTAPVWDTLVCPHPLGAQGVVYEPVQLRPLLKNSRGYQVYYIATQTKRTITATSEQDVELKTVLNKTLIASRMPSFVSRATCRLEAVEPARSRGGWGWSYHWVTP